MEAESANAEPVKPGHDLIALAEQCEDQMIKAIKVALAMEAGPIRTGQRQAASEFAICASSLRAMHFGEHGLATLTEEVVGRLAHALQPPIEVTHQQPLTVEARIEEVRAAGEIITLDGVDLILQSPGQAGKARAEYLRQATGLQIVTKARSAPKVAK